MGSNIEKYYKYHIFLGMHAELSNPRGKNKIKKRYYNRFKLNTQNNIQRQKHDLQKLIIMTFARKDKTEVLLL